MPERPNFLVIMTDQQRGDALSAAGHPILMTPNMDAIGGAGVRFSRAYSTCPVCVPARRSFLSGQHPSTHGVLNHSNIEWSGPSLPGVLRDAGYQTEWVGRGMHQTPPRKRYGFEHMVFKDHRTPDDYDDFLARRALMRPRQTGEGQKRTVCLLRRFYEANCLLCDPSLLGFFKC